LKLKTDACFLVCLSVFLFLPLKMAQPAEKLAAFNDNAQQQQQQQQPWPPTTTTTTSYPARWLDDYVNSCLYSCY
jgi:hypothetical protein